MQSLDPLTIFYVVAGLASIVGLASLFLRRRERQKLLAFEISDALPLVQVFSDEAHSRLSMTYQGPDEAPRQIDGAFVHFMRLVNFGAEPIRNVDLSSVDPLSISIRGSHVLDVSVVGVSRDVIQFRIGTFEQSAPDTVTATVTFDFLDEQDGALVQIVTDSEDAAINVGGTIVGMPHGLTTMTVLQQSRPRTITGYALSLALYVIALAAALFLFYQVTRSWFALLLFPVPILVLILPLIIIAVVGSTVWPQGTTWPRYLRLPPWARDFEHDIFYYGVGNRPRRPAMQSSERSSPASGLPSSVDIEEAWRDILKAMEPKQRAYFREAHVSVEGRSLVIHFRYAFHHKSAGRYLDEVTSSVRSAIPGIRDVELRLYTAK